MFFWITLCGLAIALYYVVASKDAFSRISNLLSAAGLAVIAFSPYPGTRLIAVGVLGAVIVLELAHKFSRR